MARRYVPPEHQDQECQKYETGLLLIWKDAFQLYEINSVTQSASSEVDLHNAETRRFRTSGILDLDAQEGRTVVIHRLTYIYAAQTLYSISVIADS